MPLHWIAVGPGTLVAAAALVLFLWYVLATLQTRRRTRRFVRGLAAGLAGLNPPPTVQWLGAAAFQVLAAGPVPPFARLAVTVVLEPREILLFWLFHRLRGRGDLVVVKGDLEKAPRAELEVYDPATPTGREAHDWTAAQRWTRAAATSGRLAWAYPARQTDPRPRWAAVVESFPFRLQRLSLRRESPHLLVSLTPPARELAGEQLLRGLRAIGTEAAGPGW